MAVESHTHHPHHRSTEPRSTRPNLPRFRLYVPPPTLGPSSTARGRSAPVSSVVGDREIPEVPKVAVEVPEVVIDLARIEREGWDHIDHPDHSRHSLHARINGRRRRRSRLARVVRPTGTIPRVSYRARGAEALRRLGRATATSTLSRSELRIATTAALLVVLAVASLAVRSYVVPPHRFVATMGPLRNDQRVLDQMAIDVADVLVAGRMVGAAERAEIERSSQRLVAGPDADRAWDQLLVSASGSGPGPEGPIDARTSNVAERYTTQLRHMVTLARNAALVTPVLALAGLGWAVTRSRHRLRLATATSTITVVGAVLVAMVAPLLLRSTALVVAQGSMLPLTQAAGEQLEGPVRRWLLALATGGIMAAMAFRALTLHKHRPVGVGTRHRSSRQHRPGHHRHDHASHRPHGARPQPTGSQ